MNKKIVFLILLISLFTVSASFAASQELNNNITSTNLDNFEKINEIDNSDKQASNFSIDEKYVINDENSVMYMTYLKHNVNLISHLRDTFYLTCTNNTTELFYGGPLNYTNHDFIIFSAYCDHYFIDLHSDFIDLERSKLVPIYIKDSAIYADYNNTNINSDYRGYLIPSSIAIRNIIRNYTNSAFPNMTSTIQDATDGDYAVYRCLRLKDPEPVVENKTSSTLTNKPTYTPTNKPVGNATQVNVFTSTFVNAIGVSYSGGPLRPLNNETNDPIKLTIDDSDLNSVDSTTNNQSENQSKDYSQNLPETGNPIFVMLMVLLISIVGIRQKR